MKKRLFIVGLTMVFAASSSLLTGWLMPANEKNIVQAYSGDVEFESDSYSVLVKETKDLSEECTLYYDSDDSVSLTWESSDESIATVNQNGIVTGKKSGTAVITVTTSMGDSCETEIWVRDISLKTDSKKTVYVGNTDSVSYSIYFDNGDYFDYDDYDEEVKFSSSKPSVAAVNEYGTIEGKKAGTTVITVSYRGKTAKCTVTVPKITVKIPSKLTVNYGTGYSLWGAATVTANKDTLVKKIKWKSSNKKVLTVSSTGYVNAKKSGKAIISMTYNGKTKKCTITVPKVKITLQSKTLTVHYNQSTTVDANYTPAGAYICVKKVTSSKKSVADAYYWNNHITVKGLKAGKSTITVTFNNGVKKKFKVKVPKLTISEHLLSQKDYATVGTIYYNTYRRYTTVTLHNLANKSVAYVKFAMLEYDNRGKRLSYNKSKKSYMHYYNDTFYYTTDIQLDLYSDTRKVSVCVKKVYYTDGKTWTNPYFNKWYRSKKKKF